MEPIHQHSDSWQEVLKVINRCPICSQNYDRDKAQVLTRQENASLVHITCANCRSSFVAMVVKMGQGISSIGMVTDLQYQDLKRLYNQEPITLDEVLEGYELFKKNENYLTFNLPVTGGTD